MPALTSKDELIATWEGVTRKFKLDRKLVKWDPVSRIVRSPLPRDLELHRAWTIRNSWALVFATG